jgi:hypothetical protein
MQATLVMRLGVCSGSMGNRCRFMGKVYLITLRYEFTPLSRLTLTDYNSGNHFRTFKLSTQATHFYELSGAA